MLLTVPQVFSILPYTCSLGGLCNQARNCDTVHLFLLWMRVGLAIFFFFLSRYEVRVPCIRQGEGGGLNGKRTLNRDCLNVLSGFAVKSPLIKPPPLYVYNHWGFQTDEQEQMSRDQRTFSPADPPDVGKNFFSQH